jgi:para-nitrobenzyl esterase
MKAGLRNPFSRIGVARRLTFMSGRYGMVRVMFICLLSALFSAQLAKGQVKTDAGLVEGTSDPDTGIRTFKGIPFAAPPVGDLRWKAPAPVTPWKGVRKATDFGARCMQGPIFSDMVFRDWGISEDCLYLNIWTPAKSSREKLPVMVWIYGGGFQAGSSSEPRQDGKDLARKGVVVVSMNYRLGVFGFMAHPELTRESGHNASGNYGLMDQIAALRWVRRNIVAFGGDPNKVTIFGESAGSFAVSGLMASPLAQGLFHRAIGESGAFFGGAGQTLAQRSLADAERLGSQFSSSMGANSIAELRSKPAQEVLQAALKSGPFRFSPIIDGYVVPRDVPSIYAEGTQSHVPLLAGWNADESRAFVVLSKQRPTAASFTQQLKARFGDRADEALKLYPASSDGEALESAASLASDSFIGYVTWKWIEAHSQTGGSPVYRYSFDKAPPVAPDTKVNGMPATAKDIGARHAGEIEYVFGALKSVNVPWEPADWKLSDAVMTYWSNFAKTGNPNGSGLPKWPAYDRKTGYQVMHLDTGIRAAPDAHRARYEFLDSSK